MRLGKWDLQLVQMWVDLMELGWVLLSVLVRGWAWGCLACTWEQGWVRMKW